MASALKSRRRLWQFVAAAGAYTAAAYVYDVLWRRWAAVKAAKAYAGSTGKPVLNVGSGTWGSSLTGPKLDGDVNCDTAAAPAATCARDRVCYCDAQAMPQFTDKQFGAVVASHILEHVAEPAKALAEWRRVGDRIFVVLPSWWAPHTWTHPGHYWYFPRRDPDAAPVALWPLPSAKPRT